MKKIQVHYALQTCDVNSYQGQKRFASDNRTEISKKCVKSFLESIKYCSEERSEAIHNICIIDDHSTKELKYFLQNCLEKYMSDKVKIELVHLKDETGIKQSISNCYHWLQKNGRDIIYQLQDDYLFSKTCIYEMIDVYFQVLSETNSQPIISPWNDSWLWLTCYRNKPTPRTVIVGKSRYWIQYYDMSCSFLTSHSQFSQHWDLYYRFFELIDKVTTKDKDLENASLNYMLTQRGILGLVPVNTLAHHLQSDLEKDPFVDYKPLWNSFDVS